MKIFWQNMVKISEEKQLTTLAVLALRRQVSACQTLDFHSFTQTLSPRFEALAPTERRLITNGNKCSSGPVRANKGGPIEKTQRSHSPSIFLTTCGFFHL